MTNGNQDIWMGNLPFITHGQQQQQQPQPQVQQPQEQTQLQGFFDYLRNTGQFDLGIRPVGGVGGFGFSQVQTPLIQFFQGLENVQNLSTQDLIDQYNAFTADLNRQQETLLDPDVQRFRFQPTIKRQRPQVDFSQFGRGPISPLQRRGQGQSPQFQTTPIRGQND